MTIMNGSESKFKRFLNNERFLSVALRFRMAFFFT